MFTSALLSNTPRRILVGVVGPYVAPTARLAVEQVKRLIREVHRRSLWQVLAIYAGASWVVFEVVQTVTQGLYARQAVRQY